MRMVTSNILSDTKGIQPVTFGRTLIVSTEKKIEYATITKPAEISGASSEDQIYKKVEAFFSGASRTPDVDVVGDTTLTDESTLKTFLDKLILEHNDFFFIMLDKFDKTLTPALCKWATSNGCIAAYVTSESVSIDEVTQLAKQINSNAIAFDGQDYLDAITIGFMTTTKPGYLPWSWRELQGAIVNKRPTSDQAKLLSSNINFINEERRGVNILIPGKTTFGEFVKNEWGKANMLDDMHIAVVNILKSNNPPAHPGADLSAANIFDQAVFSVISDYAGSDRKFIATWTEEESAKGETTRKAGEPKGWVKTKTKYTDNDIKTGVFTIEWAAMPRGECLSGTIQGLLTFNSKDITGGEN